MLKTNLLVKWLCLSGCLFGAEAEQFLLLDTVYSHTSQDQGQSFFTIPGNRPANWISPVDYAGGTVHIRLEVRDKPSAVVVTFQACLGQDTRTLDKRACSQGMELADPGVFTWFQPITTLDQSQKIDWSRKLLEQVLVLKDCFRVPVDKATSNWAGSPFLALYFPMQVRFSAAVVSKGAVFSGWQTLPISIRKRKNSGLINEGYALTVESNFALWNGIHYGPELRILDLNGRTLSHFGRWK